MNVLRGHITEIESSKAMSVVQIDVDGDIFSAIVLETPSSARYLRAGHSVDLIFKETEVAVAKDLMGAISIRNRAEARITQIISRGILSEITLAYKNWVIRSIITTGSLNRLRLKIGDNVQWLVKTTEMSLAQGNPKNAD